MVDRESFQVLLPIVGHTPSPVPTHVATMSGDPASFFENLSVGDRTDEAVLEVLRLPLGSVTIAVVSAALAQVGGAAVVSVESI